MEPGVDLFSYNHPEITEIKPHKVHIHEVITIFGKNFNSKETIVKIDDKLCSPVSITNNKITVKLPSDISPGLKTVEVVVQSISNKKYRFNSNISVIILEDSS